VILSAFEYVRAGSGEEALGLLAQHGDEAKLLAGGHSLLPLMKFRLAAPALLIDIGRVTDLSYIRADGDEVRIGALTRHHDVEYSELLRRHVPLLASVAGRVGDRQVRCRGTLGGSIAHGDPASDLPAAVLALGGWLVVRGPAGERVVAAADFFRGFLETVLEPDEMIVEIRIARRDGAGWSFQKFVKRAQDWAIVGAAVITGDRPGVGLVNMDSTPVRALAVERAIASGASPADAASVADEGTSPTSDLNASAEFRRHLARLLVRRGLEEAVARQE